MTKGLLTSLGSIEPLYCSGEEISNFSIGFLTFERLTCDRRSKGPPLLRKRSSAVVDNIISKRASITPLLCWLLDL